MATEAVADGNQLFPIQHPALPLGKTPHTPKHAQAHAPRFGFRNLLQLNDHRRIELRLGCSHPIQGPRLHRHQPQLPTPLASAESKRQQ